jgi:hypothetical protein
MGAGIAKEFESRYGDKSELMEKGERLIGEVISITSSLILSCDSSCAS